MYRDNYGRFSNLRAKLLTFGKYALFVFVASIYVPISAVWVGKQAYETAYGFAEQKFADVSYVSTTSPVTIKDRREEIEAELRPSFEKALMVAVEEKLAQEKKQALERELEEIRKAKLESPLP